MPNHVKKNGKGKKVREHCNNKIFKLQILWTTGSKKSFYQSSSQNSQCRYAQLTKLNMSDLVI